MFPRYLKAAFMLRPWPNGVASQRKFGNGGWLYRLAMGGQTDSQLKKRKKNISVQTCPRARTKENRDQPQLALSGQKVKNLRSFTCKFEVDQIERKFSEAIANGTRKSWPNGATSYHKWLNTVCSLLSSLR